MDERTINLLKEYELLPKRRQGARLAVEFRTPKQFRSSTAEVCTPLGLELGATIEGWVRLKDVDYFTLFASNDVAERLLRLPPDTEVFAHVRTLFGVASRVEWSEDGPITIHESLTGLLVEAIVDRQCEAAA